MQTFQHIVFEDVNLLNTKIMSNFVKRFCTIDLHFIHRDTNGRLHLVQDIGKIPLVNTKLIEDPSETRYNDDGEYIRKKY